MNAIRVFRYNKCVCRELSLKKHEYRRGRRHLYSNNHLYASVTSCINTVAVQKIKIERINQSSVNSSFVESDTYLNINFGRSGIVRRCHGTRQSSESTCLVSHTRPVIPSLHISVYNDSSSNNIIGVTCTVGRRGRSNGEIEGGLRQASRGTNKSIDREHTAAEEDRQQKKGGRDSR